MKKFMCTYDQEKWQVKLYIKSSFDQKTDIKELGGRFDWEIKQWYFCLDYERHFSTKDLNSLEYMFEKYKIYNFEVTKVKIYVFYQFERHLFQWWDDDGKRRQDIIENKLLNIVKRRVGLYKEMKTVINKYDELKFIFKKQKQNLHILNNATTLTEFRNQAIELTELDCYYQENGLFD